MLSGTNKGDIINLCALQLGSITFAAICRAGRKRNREFRFSLLGALQSQENTVFCVIKQLWNYSHNSLRANVHAQAWKCVECEAGDGQ